MRAWTVLLLPAVARAARCAELPDGQMLPGFDGGDDEDARAEWLSELQAVRAACQEDFDATIYERADLAWTRTSYIQTQMHPFDRTFYERGVGYTPSRFLDDLRARYGGVDALLLWPTYPNIGADARNQFDMFASMPGGLDALAAAVAELEAAGVRVLLPYNPWDVSTNRSELDDARALGRLRAQLGADGFNGDTMSFVNASFWAADPGAAIEPEVMGTPQMKNWHTLGWGYWAPPAWAPGVDFYKWAVDARWMTHACERWNKNHTSFVLNAYFNGVGFESWENVWGTWNGIVPRDGELVRRAAAVLRHFGGERGLLSDPAWRPHAADVRDADAPKTPAVFGSRFGGADADADERVYLVVNVADRAARAAVDVGADRAAYDCYAGAPLAPDAGGAVAARVGPLDLGCVYVAPRGAAGAPPPETAAFLARVANLTAAPLDGFSAEWTFLNQTLLDAGRAVVAGDAPPAGMLAVPAADAFRFAVASVVIEGDDGHGVDVQYPWEPHPRREHDRALALPPFWIDRFPVTNADYAAYLDATGYEPDDPARFLAHWAAAGAPRAPPAGAERQPVRFVSRAEAQAFCAWRGARLPRSWEWQYAAQGLDGRLYPWGNASRPECYPAAAGGPDDPAPVDVDAFDASCASPFGVEGLVGNVWQWTDEFEDAHTRAAVVRGSGRYAPTAFGGSYWYFPQALELNKHNKYLLMDDAYDRTATFGFRCVADAE